MDRINLEAFVGVGIGLLVGMIGHEYAHARLAVALGDQTPRMTRRLTLNPKAHVDTFGTLVMPAVFLLIVLFNAFADFGFIFGYAKPIPVTRQRLRKPKRDAVLVALAGPAFTLAVALVAGLGFRALTTGGSLRDVLGWIVVTNSFLFIINLLPIPPLDGSRIVARFLSPSAAMRYEEFGQYLVLVLIVFFLFFRGVLDNMGAAVYEPILGIG